MNDEDFQRLDKDSEINTKRTSTDILHIKLNVLLIGDVLTSADLPQTSDARFHRETFWSVLIIQLLITNIVYQMT